MVSGGFCVHLSGSWVWIDCLGSQVWGCTAKLEPGAIKYQQPEGSSIHHGWEDLATNVPSTSLHATWLEGRDSTFLGRGHMAPMLAVIVCVTLKENSNKPVNSRLCPTMHCLIHFSGKPLRPGALLSVYWWQHQPIWRRLVSQAQGQVQDIGKSC